MGLAACVVACGGSGPDGVDASVPVDAQIPARDGAPADGASADAALPDGALPDGALPDGALPDGALVDAGPADASAPPETHVRPGPACTDSGWCWETPLPGGGEIHGLASPAPGHLVVSTQQRFFHRDPAGWIGTALSPTFTRLLGLVRVWGAAPDDVWAAAPEGGAHFDGVEWTSRDDLFYAVAVHGWDASDVWACGGGAYQHFDGVAWTPTTGGTFSYNDVWAIGPGEAIVVGNAGVLGAFARRVVAGGAGTDLPAPPAGPRFFRAVYASSATDVWAGSEVGLHRFSGGAWSSMSASRPVELWGSGAGDVWAATDGTNVLHWNGASLESIPVPGAASLASITGTAPDDVWVGDAMGGLHHWDGAGWTTVKAPLAPSSIESVAIRDDGTGWATTGDALLERAADGAWTRATPPTTMRLQGVAVAGDETFLFSAAGAYRRAGAAWASVPGGAGLMDACTTSDGITLGVGDGVFARFASGAWSAQPAPNVRSVQSVRCVGREAFAILDGAVVHWDGESWGRLGLVSIAGLPVLGAHSTATDDAWLVAGDASGSALMRFDGVEWREVIFDSPSHVLSVGGSSPTDVWVAGEGGLVRRWDGAVWTTLDVGVAVDLAWIDGDADGRARALTRRGAVWAYDGAAWTEASPGFAFGVPFSSDFVDDAAFVGDEIFAIGDSDEPLRWAAGSWEELPGTAFYDHVAASDTAGAWFFGSTSGVGHWTGTLMDRPSVGRTGTIDIAVVGGDAFFVTRYDALRIVGTTLEDEVHVSGVITAFFGSGADAAWVLSPPEISDDRFEVQREEAGTWSIFPELASPVGFSAAPSGDVLAVTAETGLFRRSGGVLTVLAPSRPGLGVVATHAHPYAADDAWALDRSTGGMVHWDGASWTPYADAVGFGFRTYEVTPSGELFAAGDRGAVASHERRAR